MKIKKSEESQEPPSTLPFKVTQYYKNVIQNTVLEKTIYPNQTISNSGIDDYDPLNEDVHAHGCCIHRYPDRALFLATNKCAVHCQYCTRQRHVGQQGTQSGWTQGFEYIENHPEIHDIIVSGGDPLILPVSTLDYILTKLRKIPHVEIIRIGSKIPIVFPQLVTDELCNMLQKHHPLFMNIHCTHPIELTDEVKIGLNRLSNAGIPLGSQTVLLKGVNDDVLTLKKLFTGLLACRVRPYYLYQCDLIPGTERFWTPLELGEEIIDSLRGRISGLAIPNFVCDAPGLGKVVIEKQRKFDNEVMGFEGKTFCY